MNEFARKQLLKTSSYEHTDDNRELPAGERLRGGGKITGREKRAAIVCVVRNNFTKAPIFEIKIA